ncbi:MAG: hypothetical protein GY754_43995 [bacterium]|nr:hypothetical protein [bacterium]
MNRKTQFIELIQKNAAGIIIFFMVSSLFGYFYGRVTGSLIIKSFLTSSRRLSLILYRPATEFYTMRKLLRSENELERLSGYYALLDNNMIDEDYLLELYTLEPSIVVKRTIIWILGFSDDFDSVKKSYSKIYAKADPLIKNEILRTLRRNDKEYYQKFIEQHKVKSEILDFLK